MAITRIREPVVWCKPGRATFELPPEAEEGNIGYLLIMDQ
jgi:hypothetical protein